MKRFALFDGHQILGAHQLFQLGVVHDAGQLKAVNLFILAEHGIVRALQNRVPYDVTVMYFVMAVTAIAPHSRGGRGGHQRQQKNSNEDQKAFSGSHGVRFRIKLQKLLLLWMADFKSELLRLALSNSPKGIKKVNRTGNPGVRLW